MRLSYHGLRFTTVGTEPQFKAPKQACSVKQCWLSSHAISQNNWSVDLTEWEDRAADRYHDRQTSFPAPTVLLQLQ